MQLVEQHVIRKRDSRYAAIDAAAFASKNLYNQATYQMRQVFIHEGKYLPYAEIFHRVKHLECYQALPRKVSNSILILIHKNWISFFRALEAWKAHPEQFTGRPKIPGYKHKERGRNILIYDKQALLKRAFKKTGKLVPSGLPIEIETKVAWEALAQVRIIPRGSCYVVEVVYRQAEKQAQVDPLCRFPTAGLSRCSSTRHSLLASRWPFGKRVTPARRLFSIWTTFPPTIQNERRSRSLAASEKNAAYIGQRMGDGSTRILMGATTFCARNIPKHSPIPSSEGRRSWVQQFTPDGLPSEWM